MSKQVWVGIDVSKKTFWAAVAQVDQMETWTDLPACGFEHSEKGLDAFVHWLSEQNIDKSSITGVCIESTGRLSTRWSAALDGRLGPVSIVNPAHPSHFGKSLGLRDTNDRIDACVLALFGKTMRPKATTLLGPNQVALRELFRLYQALGAQWTANRLRLQDGPSTSLVRKLLKQTIKSQRRQLDKLEAEMDAVIADDAQMREDARRMQTIPGVARKTVRVILAELGDLRAYKRNELVALAGVYPKEYSSGTSVYKKPRLAKGGCGRVRKALYMCAMVARQYNPQMRRFSAHLGENGKCPMQCLGAIMRKLLLLMRTLVVNESVYDPSLGVYT